MPSPILSLQPNNAKRHLNNHCACMINPGRTTNQACSIPGALGCLGRHLALRNLDRPDVRGVLLYGSLALLIATWNVNSIRARLDRALAWLDAHQPDVLCLQETKVTDDKFPEAVFAEKGYHTAFWGQKSYNGVAILARTPPEDVQRGFGALASESSNANGAAEEAREEANEEARLLAATVAGVRIYSCYVPNGKVMGSPSAAAKLRWLDNLGKILDTHAAGDLFAVCGDFNIAWDERDVHDPAFWRTQVLYHPSMQEALHTLAGSRLIDTFRQHHEEAEKYSWWDYRMLGFPKNKGLRIDYVFASEALSATCTDASIDRNERKGKVPSDHAPVLAHFDVAT
jgi:exodeoxyribonuclease-3